MVKKNLFSIILALIILYLSLAGSDNFEKISIFNILFIDKIVHFGMYFALMSVIIFENRKSIKSTTHLFLTALIPLFYGILMEVLQLSFTISRSGSYKDVIFNSAGILVSLLIYLWIKPMPHKTVRK